MTESTERPDLAGYACSSALPGETLIGGIQVVVTATTSAGLSIQASDVTATGAGASPLVFANTTYVASVDVAVLNSSGFPAGEVATLNYHVANGTFPGRVTSASRRYPSSKSTALPFPALRSPSRA